MTPETKKKEFKKNNETIVKFLLSKKGSAKEKVLENKIHDIFDEKAKNKAKENLIDKTLKSKALKDTIEEFNKYNKKTKSFPTINEVKEKVKIEQAKIVKEKIEKIDKAFDKKKQERVKAAVALTLQEINNKSKTKAKTGSIKVETKTNNKKAA